MVTENSAQRLDESKCHPDLQEGQLGRLRKQARQPHFYPSEVYGTAIPGKPCQAYEGGKNNVVSAWIHQGKFCLTTFYEELDNSYEESAFLVDEGNIVCLGFRDVFDIYVHSSTRTYLKG